VKALDPLLAPSFMGKTATEADALRDVACAAIDRALASNKERAVLRPAEAASLGRGNEELRKTAVSDLKSAELVVRLERMNNIMTDKLQ